MHIFLVATGREVLVKFPRVPSESQHRKRLPIVPSVREGNINQFLLRVPITKAQAPEVSGDQVIIQAIKAMHSRPLHSHLVREWPKTIVELY
jgi:hypothetical protein